MAKRLALTLIIAGTVGIFAWGGNVKEAIQISEKIRNEFKYKQTTEAKRRLEIESDPLMKNNAIYGGCSAAGALASVFAVGGGCYLLKKRNYEEID